MTIRMLAAAAAALAISASGTFAADLAIAPAAEPLFATQSAYDWTGFYVGVNGGYDWAELAGTAAGSRTLNLDGWTGGVQLGANYDLGGFVLGAEGDLNLSDVNLSERTSALTTATYDMKYYGTVRARAGYAFDRFLPYVTGGVAFARIDSTLDIDGIGRFASGNTDHVGWTIGAGAEYAVTDNLSLRGEYLYGDLGKADHLNVNRFLVVSQAEARLTYQTARIGLNYKF